MSIHSLQKRVATVKLGIICHYSTSVNDVTVRLFKHVSPYTAYAPDFTVNLGTSWLTFTTEFNTTGFSSTVNEGRFQFWLLPFTTA